MFMCHPSKIKTICSTDVDVHAYTLQILYVWKQVSGYHLNCKNGQIWVTTHHLTPMHPPQIKNLCRKRLDQKNCCKKIPLACCTTFPYKNQKYKQSNTPCIQLKWNCTCNSTGLFIFAVPEAFMTLCTLIMNDTIPGYLSNNNL